MPGMSTSKDAVVQEPIGGAGGSGDRMWPLHRVSNPREIPNTERKLLSFPITAPTGVADVLISASKSAWIISVVLKETRLIWICFIIIMNNLEKEEGYMKDVAATYHCLPILTKTNQPAFKLLFTTQLWGSHSISPDINNMHMACIQGRYNTHKTKHSVRLNHLLVIKDLKPNPWSTNNTPRMNWKPYNEVNNNFKKLANLSPEWSDGFCWEDFWHSAVIKKSHPSSAEHHPHLKLGSLHSAIY